MGLYEDSTVDVTVDDFAGVTEKPKTKTSTDNYNQLLLQSGFHLGIPLDSSTM